MAFQKDDQLVQFADLKGILSQVRVIDPALYQTVQTLLERLDQFKIGHDSIVNNINNSVNTILQNIIVTPNITATYLTKSDEVFQLPQSVQLLAGTNIIFDDTIPNKRTISSTGSGPGGGMDLDYLGNYTTPKTYSDGDIVIGPDGIAYMCVKDGTTTPPEVWPGSSVSPIGIHHTTHQIGGTDIIDIKLLGGYPGGATTFLRADGTFAIPSSVIVVSAHHVTHETGGTDAITALSGAVINSGTIADARLSNNVALRNVTNTFTANQLISVSVNAEFRLNSTGGPVNGKFWRILNNSNLLRFDPLDDSNTVQVAVTFDRQGIITAGGLGTTPLNASQLLSGTIPDIRLSTNVPLKNQSNVFTADQTISKIIPILNLNDTNGPVNGRNIGLINFLGTAYFQMYDDAGGLQINALAVNRIGDIFAAGSITEFNRATPLGHWISFTPIFGGATLVATVIAKYTLIGKTMILTIYVQVTIAGSPTNFSFVIPGGFVALGQTANALIGQDGWTAMLQTIPSSNTVHCYRDTSGGVAWPNGTFYLAGTASFEIQ